MKISVYFLRTVMTIFGGMCGLMSVSSAAASGIACNPLPRQGGFLDSIHAPVKVTTGPSDAYIGLSMMPDGELRHYNYGEQADAGSFYLSSRDHGLTWRKVNSPRDMPQADVASRVSGEYVRLVNMGADGVYCIRTQGGPKGNRTVTKVDSIGSIMIKPPVFARDGKLMIVAAHGGEKGCYTYVSDDDGLTWQRSNTVVTPPHTGGGFHKGIRWNHGAVEPTVVELTDGRLWMLMRTPHDKHYEAFSEDGGLTWSEPRQSRFYGTITMPTIGRLKDGRLIFFWCNTTPLPELATANGVWDDVFTNRDVTHVAISDDDGKTWRGFRELMLDPMRNESDYALRGGGIDRGMHQAQFVEPEPGKIVAAIGQHPLHRAIVAFDTDWLYETERTDDFSDSLRNWTTFNYIKGIKGHCSYNRINGVELMAHPDRQGQNVLSLRYDKADSLVSDIRGAVWNFPALRQGEFTASIRLPEGAEGHTMVLNDRWMNPCDTVARYEGIYILPLSRKELGIKDDRWHTLTVEWDVDRSSDKAIVRVDGRRRKIKLPMSNPTADGISYVHFLAEPAENDSLPAPLFIERVAAKQRQPR